ncbi:MAG: hypothetical protein WCE90_08095 [Candidatus Zixiibacteriota bacterium]
MKSMKVIATIEVILILAAAASLMLVAGCGSTQLVNLWKDPSYQAAPLKKILVIAMRKGQLNRRMWEDAFVLALKEDKAGTVGVPSYQLFPDEIPDTLEVQDTTKAEGFDGVLLVARIEHGTVKTDVAGYVSSEPYTDYSYRWATYVTRYLTVYHPGYTDSQTVVSVRTDLLLAQENGRLVWSATSEEIDPSSADQFRKSVADLVMDKLAKQRIVR